MAVSGGRALPDPGDHSLPQSLPHVTAEPRLSRLARVALTEVLSPLRPWERELKPACRVWYWPRDAPVDKGCGSLARLTASCLPACTLGPTGVGGCLGSGSCHLSPRRQPWWCLSHSPPRLQLCWGSDMLTP